MTRPRPLWLILLLLLCAPLTLYAGGVTVEPGAAAASASGSASGGYPVGEYPVVM